MPKADSAKPTTTEPSDDTSPASLWNAPPGRSPRPWKNGADQAVKAAARSHTAMLPARKENPACLSCLMAFSSDSLPLI